MSQGVDRLQLLIRLFRGQSVFKVSEPRRERNLKKLMADGYLELVPLDDKNPILVRFGKRRGCTLHLRATRKGKAKILELARML